MLRVYVPLYLLASLGVIEAQTVYRISTVAGSGAVTFAGEGGPATQATLVDPAGAAQDSAGHVYITDSFLHQVFRVAPNGVITRIAGTGVAGSAGDNGPALQAQFFRPNGVAVDRSGNVYVADSGNSRIRLIRPDGVISTLAGPQAPASLSDPIDLVLSSDGARLFFSEHSRHRVRAVVLGDASVVNVAGTGVQGDAGEGGPAGSALLNTPIGLGLDKDGLLLIADSLNFKLKRVTSAGNIVTVAGNGQSANTGNGGSALAASLPEPADAFGAADGSIYISNLRNGGIRVVSAAGTIGGFGSGSYENPVAIAPLNDGGFLIVRQYGRAVSRVSNGAVSSFAGTFSTQAIGDGGPATSAKFFSPIGVARDAAGDLFVGDFKEARVRRIKDGNITTFSTSLVQGEALAFDRSGRLYATSGSSVLRFASDGSATRIAGTGSAGFSGDGAVANTAQLQFAEGLAIDAAGNIFIADTRNHRIRRVDGATSIITTIAGTGEPGFSGDDGPATGARLNFPRGLAAGSDGTLYVADSGNHRLRAISSNGRIRTVAGTGSGALSGAGGPAIAAGLPAPMGVHVDANNVLYVAGVGNVWRIGADGNLQTLAGTGSLGFSGDGGPGVRAQINEARGIVTDPAGNVWFAERGNQRVRKLEPIAPAKGVVHSASFLEGPIAAGQIISIFAADLGPAAGAGAILGPDGVLLTTIGGVQVTFNGTPGPIFFTNSSQVNVQVPYEVAGAGIADIRITVNGVLRTTLATPVAAAVPAIYSLSGGKGQIVALNQNGSLNGAAAPAKAGEVIVFFASGDGQTNPGSRTGVPAAAPLPVPALPVAVTIGGQTARVLYGGPAPGFAGLMQLNVLVPEGAAPGGGVPIVLTVGNAKSPEGTTIAIGQ
jgi:trimeric autotransporter adhesin